ncbi:hypothetical protein [Litchfieldia salsa]|uniref:Uncharacterized protein n=1 Tax=Litchfieldia salsa TaxID=930152 RepID=A0A1H0WYE9_9BACI|nr:hypothetical protein [Litchfieldia salsa]SDP95764.1 hypothetical protein SAMN05216565_11944 [Litchfieldia salsa]
MKLLLPVSLVVIVTLVITALSLSPSPLTEKPDVSIEEQTENKYLSFQALNSKKLENDDLELFQTLKNNIQISNQVMNELDFLLNEYATSDSLDGAMEAMEIAYEESVVLVRDIQTRFDPNDPTLLELKERYTTIMTHYIEGLSNQLTAIESGDIEKMNHSLNVAKQSKQEILLLVSVLEKKSN